MNKLNLKWSTGNEKLKKLDTISFNLPAYKSADGFHVCPQAGACASMCYARQGRYLMPSVQDAREFNLAIARGGQPTFRNMLVQDLRSIRNKVVRIHDSGDFFSQDYLDSWIWAINQAGRGKSFYAYTKSLHLDWSQKPKNLQIVQSVGGLMDAEINRRKSHSRIFVNHADRIKAGYVNGNVNDGPAIRGEQKIGLVYHGNKSLKEGQIRYLRMAK